MAERVLFIAWGHPIPGREKQGLEVFNEAVAYYGELQGAGRIERFDTVVLEPNIEHQGFFVLYGTHAQIDAVREDARFMRITMDAGMMVEGLCQIEGFTGDGLAQTMPMYQEAAGHVPQMA